LTFPTNRILRQHNNEIIEDDIHYECTLLAGHILGIECSDVGVLDAKDLDTSKNYYVIEPEPHKARNAADKEDCEAFLNYFHSNYGKHPDRCYFDTVYEAFYSLIKAWFIWREILTPNQKNEYNY
jgi:hypothetical protein